VSIVADMRTYLLTQSGVTGLCSTRVYFSALPQNITLPAVVLERTDTTVPSRTLAATGSLYRSEITAYAYGATESAMAGLGDALHAAIEFDTGTWGSSTVDRSFVEHYHDLVEEPWDGSQAWRFVRAMFCVVWHQ